MTVLLPNNQKPVVDASGKPTAPFSRWMRDVSAGSSSTADASVEELPDSGIGSAMVKLTRDAYGRIAGMQPATTTDLIEGGSLYFTDARAQAAVVIDSIADADTNHAPSRNAVFDALALKADKAITISTAAPLTGGGDLSANRTLAISAATTTSPGTMSDADKLKLDAITTGEVVPTTFANTNVTTHSATLLRYSRVGTMVTFSGRVDVAPTVGGSTVTQVGVSIPIASNFGASSDAYGTVSVGEAPYIPGLITSDAVNDRITVTFYANTTASRSVIFTGQYRII